VCHWVDLSLSIVRLSRIIVIIELTQELKLATLLDQELTSGDIKWKSRLRHFAFYH
jgi:hypothetical protein